MSKSEAENHEVETDEPELAAEVEADIAAAKEHDEAALESDEAALDAVHEVRVEGEPNGLPPAAPEVQLDPPAEVKTLREWFHVHIDNGGAHAQDTDHRNSLHSLMETIVAKIHAKYPVEKGA